MIKKANLTLAYPGTVVLFALAVLIGWNYDINALKKILPDGVSMNPLTAILFFCCSLVLVLNFRYRNRTRLGNFLSVAVLSIAVLKLLSYLGAVEFRMDQWIFTSKLREDQINGIGNEMAPNTALNFALLGIALLLYRSHRKMNIISDCLSLIVAATGFISLIGYLYNAKELYGISHYIPMAVPTAICFLFLSIAILLNRKGSFVLRTLSNQHTGTKMARYLLPVAIIVPILLGLLRLYGQEAGFFSSNFGTALFAAVNILLFIIFILRSAASINRSDEILLHELEERKKIEAKLRESEGQLKGFNKLLEKKVEERTFELDKNNKMFRSLIENSVDVISMLDADARFLFASAALEKLTGRRPEEVIKARAFSFVHPEDLKHIIELFHRVRSNPGIVFSSTIRILHKDGSYRWVDGTIINLLEDENVKAIVTNFHDITARKKAEEMKSMLERNLLQEKIDKQVQVTQATILGQEKEKKEIGMELHDNVNQILAASKLYLDMADIKSGSAEEMINRSKEGICQAIQEIRKLSRVMVPPSMGVAGIISSIKEFADLICQSANLHVDISMPQEIVNALDESKRLAVYRIIQEQLNNVVKHAEARNTMIVLSKTTDQAVLKIVDDGKGFNLSAIRSGIGLSNIQSRVDMLKGRLDIHSSPGRGCELIIQLPCVA